MGPLLSLPVYVLPSRYGLVFFLHAGDVVFVLTVVCTVCLLSAMGRGAFARWLHGQGWLRTVVGVVAVAPGKGARRMRGACSQPQGGPAGPVARDLFFTPLKKRARFSTRDFVIQFGEFTQQNATNANI